MPDRQAYNASTIDWSRIHAYAQRVARETRTPAENAISYVTTEYQTVTKHVEIKHGLFNLFTRVENKSEQVTVNKRVDVVGRHWVLERRHHHIERNTRERTYTNQETTHEHHLSDLSDSDIEAMDFEKRHSEYGTHGRGTKSWGDRDPGKRLLSHTKGVGLTKALKRLLPS